MNREFKSGDIVSHFKRETVDQNTTKYLYSTITANFRYTSVKIS